MIECKSLIKKYGERTVLDIPSLKIENGERVALTGSNGSGKSTLLKAVSGIIPFEGEINTKGRLLYMPQKNIPFDMTVLTNVTFSMTGKRKEKEEKAFEALKKTGLDALYKKNACVLSGGEQARLALARILVLDCDILLLDEPTGAVDIEAEELIEKTISDYINEKNRTLILSTHSPLQAKRLTKRVLMLDKGKIAEDSSSEEFILSPKTDFGKKFIDMWRVF